MAREPEDRYRDMPGRWPTTSSGGWPTSPCRPGASRFARVRRRGRGGTARPSTAAAVALVAGVVGLLAVLAVQTRAKA